MTTRVSVRWSVACLAFALVAAGCGGGGGGTPADAAAEKKQDTGTGDQTGGEGGAEVKPDAGADQAADSASEAGADTATEGGTEAAAESGADADDAGDDTAADTGPEGPGCTPECTLGAKQCGGGGGLQACANDLSGCPKWGSEVACGPHQSCTGTAPSAACTCNDPGAGCTAAGTFCPSTGSVSTCAVDSDGCKYVSGTTACATNKSCKGTLPSGSCSCDDTCTAADVGTFCVDAKTLATCAADSNSPACHLKSGDTACVGAKTCQGSPGTASCQCPPVPTGAPTAGAGCTSLGATACDGDNIITCVTDSASGCNAWQVSTDCNTAPPTNLTCGTPGAGAPTCFCRANAGAMFYADPVAGSDAETAGFRPTGVIEPPGCRFATLGKALSKATDPGDTVMAISDAPPVSFDAETFPLVVPADVSVRTDDSSSGPADYTVVFDDASATSAFDMESGSYLAGFTVSNADGNAGAAAILAECASGSVTVAEMDLRGTGTGGASSTTMTYGIEVENSCAVTVREVSADDFDQAAFYVDSGSTTSTSTFTNCTAKANLQHGVRVLGGTVTLLDVTIESSGTAGIELYKSSSDMKFIGGGLIVRDSGQEGIRVPSTGNSAVLDITLYSNEIRNSGDCPSPGIAIQTAATVTIDSSKVHTNGCAGLLVDAGTVTIGTTYFDDNGQDEAAPGIRVTGGSVTGNTVFVNGNSGSGLHQSSVGISGSTVVLHAATFSNNGGRGVLLESGSCTIDRGSIVDSNGTGATKSDGIMAQGGTLNVCKYSPCTGGALGSDVHVMKNGLDGIVLLGATATINGALIHENGSDGVEIDSGTSVIEIKSSSIHTNQQHGVHVHRALQAGSGANSLTIDGNSIYDNGTVGAISATGIGIWLRGDVGDVTASVKASKVYGNKDVGIMIQSKTGRTDLRDNDVYTNNAGANRPAGGIVFNSTHNLTAFTGNKIHGNTGDEMAFNQPPAGPNWNIASPTNSCTDGTANQIYCYGAGGVGVAIADGVLVHARYVHWANDAPASGADFSATIPLQLDGLNPCPKVTTCP